MANVATYTGYHHAPGGRSTLRTWAVTFSGDYVQDNGEVIDLAADSNPNGIEYDSFPQDGVPEGAPFILGSTLGGYKPELQTAPSTPGQWGITFWDGTTQLAAGAYAFADGSNVIIGLLSKG